MAMMGMGDGGVAGGICTTVAGSSPNATEEESGASLVENASMRRDERVLDGGGMVADVCGGMVAMNGR